MLKTIKELSHYLLPYKYKLLFGIVLLFGAARAEIENPVILRYTVDELNSQSVSMDKIYLYVAIILGLMLLKGIFLYYSRYILIGLSRRVEYDMRNRFFRHLTQLEPAFFDSNKTGDLISRMTSDLEQIRMIFGPGVMYTFNVFFLVILALINMTDVDLSLTLLSIIPLLLLVFLIRQIGSKYYEKSRLVQEELAEMTTFVNENLQGIRVIKSYVKEGFIQSSFQKVNVAYVKKNLDLAKLSGIFRPMLYLIAGFSSVVVLWIGGSRVLDGKMSLGNLVEFLRYIEILSMPLMAMGWVMTIFQRGNAAYHRMKTVYDRAPRINDLEADPSISRIKWDVDIRNLSFAYEKSSFLSLDNISFHIREGEKVAIIGPTGSGKTTLVSLLLRLYDPPPGSIVIDGNPIHRIPLKVLRQGIGHVPQENFIFPDSIRENILFGSLYDRSPEHIEEVVRLAQFEEEVKSFPKAYEEMIGEKGVTLSGGQKQRLSIARALSSQPAVLIMDDSFSNVDSETERLILANIHRLYREQTVIIIAHRASTIQDMDKIIVLDGGRIREMGKPHELIASGGYYSILLENEKLSHTIAGQSGRS